MYCFIPIYIPGPIRTKQIGTVMNRGPKTGPGVGFPMIKTISIPFIPVKTRKIPVLLGLYRYTGIFLRYGAVQYLRYVGIPESRYTVGIPS